MRAKMILLLAGVTAGLLAAGAGAQSRGLTFTVETGDGGRVQAPVSVLVPWPANRRLPRSVQVIDADGQRVPGQLVTPGLHSRGEEGRPVSGYRELHFVAVRRTPPGHPPRSRATFRAVFSDDPAPDGFSWKDTPGEQTDLLLAGRPVLRYVYRALDETSKESRELTYKPFHHLFAPDGSRLLTKGPGGQFTHHRGLFFAFNRVSYGDGKKADVWHCSGDAYQSHEKVLAREAGPVAARQRVEIAWRGPGKEVFAREEREFTVYSVPGGQLLDFASRLTSEVGPVRLDGDPQHAGFHFRADNEVAEVTKHLTYYLRPDGRGKPGETRNWPANREHVNLPWNAMSFVLGGKRYTALYLDSPLNPKEARYSEREYGRFGSYFEYDLDRERPLAVRYRVWVQEGEMTGEEAAARSRDFTAPVRTTVQ